MQQVRLDKVTLNIGAGEIGDEVEKAKKLLKKLSGEEPIKTKAGRNAKTFGVRKGLEIGTKITLRGKKAEDILERILQSKDSISASIIDSQGNFSLGVDEYLNVPGIKYDPEIGIMGFDVAVTLEKPGHRVKKRSKSSKIGKKHKIKKEEVIEFLENKFGVTVKRENEADNQ